MKYLLSSASLAFGLFLFSSSISYGQKAADWDSDSLAIIDVLFSQQEAWNAGDIPLFMEGYWKSEQLTFVGSRGITYGWQATLDGYLNRYPDRAAMGMLQFEVLELTSLGPDAAMLLGSWELQREADTPGGFFTLIWRRIEGRWVIVSDHTS